MKSTKTAWAVTALVVALSAFLGCNRSLAALRGETAKAIQNGDGSGYSIATDAQDMVNICRNLVTVAGKYIPGETKELEKLCDQTDSFTARMGPEALIRLRAAADEVLRELAEHSEVTEKDRGYLAGFAVDLDSAMHRMSQDPYNQKAEDFNAAEGAFPANVLGVFVGPLDTFDF